MEKKGQVTVFVLIGIIAFIAIVFFWSTTYRNVQFFSQANAPNENFDRSRTHLETHINACLKKLTDEAIVKYGLKNTKPDIENYVLSLIDGCVALDMYTAQGYKVTQGTKDVTVTIGENSVISKLSYPVTMSLNRDTVSLLDFEYVFPRKQYLLQDGAHLTEPVNFQTADGNAVVTIPQGTKFYDEDGNEILYEKISVEIVERDFPAFQDSIVTYDLVYDFGPDGVMMDKPLTFAMSYDEEDIPAPYSENDLVLMWYNHEIPVWFFLPTVVDRENNVVYTMLSHFSGVTLGFNPSSNFGGINDPPKDPTTGREITDLPGWIQSGCSVMYTSSHCDQYLAPPTPAQPGGYGYPYNYYPVPSQTPPPSAVPTLPVTFNPAGTPIITGTGGPLPSANNPTTFYYFSQGPGQPPIIIGLTDWYINQIQGGIGQCGTWCAPGSANFWQEVFTNLGVPPEWVQGNVFEFIRSIGGLETLSALEYLYGLATGEIPFNAQEFNSLLEMINNNFNAETAEVFGSVLDNLLDQPGATSDPDFLNALEAAYESGNEAVKEQIHDSIKDKIMEMGNSAAAGALAEWANGQDMLTEADYMDILEAAGWPNSGPLAQAAIDSGYFDQQALDDLNHCGGPCPDADGDGTPDYRDETPNGEEEEEDCPDCQLA
jgi:hypothetical protein